MAIFSSLILRDKYITLIKYANLIKQFTILQYKLKDQSKFLGLLWSLINPLVMLAALFSVFNKKLGVNIPHYPIYLLIGVIQYNFFINSTTIATTILFHNRYLTKNVIFPKETLVISSILSNMMQFLFEMTICMALAVFLRTPVTNVLFFIPAVCFLELEMALWAGLSLSCCHVFVKDIDNLWQIFSRLLFFITPIFFTTGSTSSRLFNAIVWLNPLSHIIKYSRMAIIDGNIPPVDSMLMFMLINSFLLFLAYKFFKHFEQFFAEYL